MTKNTLYVIGSLLGLIIIAITVLLALGRDPGRLIDLLTASIIPTIAAIWAGNRADKAKEVAIEAKDVAQQTVENTNGRMGELIQGAVSQGYPVNMDKYSDVVEHQGINVPEEQQLHGIEAEEISAQKFSDRYGYSARDERE